MKFSVLWRIVWIILVIIASVFLFYCLTSAAPITLPNVPIITDLYGTTHQLSLQSWHNVPQVMDCMNGCPVGFTRVSRTTTPTANLHAGICGVYLFAAWNDYGVTNPQGQPAVYYGHYDYQARLWANAPLMLGYLHGPVTDLACTYGWAQVIVGGDAYPTPLRTKPTYLPVLDNTFTSPLQHP